MISGILSLGLMLTNVNLNSQSFPQINLKDPLGVLRNVGKKKLCRKHFLNVIVIFLNFLANPTKTLSNRDPRGNKKKNGSHYAITKKDELSAWIFKRRKNGFRIDDEIELEISPPVFHKLYRKSDEGILVGVEFKGCLEVMDKEKLFKAAHEALDAPGVLGLACLF